MCNFAALYSETRSHYIGSLHPILSNPTRSLVLLSSQLHGSFESLSMLTIIALLCGSGMISTLYCQQNRHSQFSQRRT